MLLNILKFKAKYGAQRLRKQKKTFDNIVASKVVAKNQKLCK